MQDKVYHNFIYKSIVIRHEVVIGFSEIMAGRMWGAGEQNDPTIILYSQSIFVHRLFL